MRHTFTPTDITMIALNLIMSIAEGGIRASKAEALSRIAKLARDAIEHATHEEMIRRLEVALLDARAHRHKFKIPQGE